jgi:hypothetical protein
MRPFLPAMILTCMVLAACGANPPKVAATAAPETKRTEGVEQAKDKRVNCEKYTPIGSNRPKYRCVTVAEKKSDAEAKPSETRNMDAPPPSPPAPSTSGTGN